MKRCEATTWSRARRWTCAAIVVGVVAAYTPAMGNGSTWTLPYSGSISTSSYVFSATNTASGGSAIYASGSGQSSVGVVGYGATGVFGSTTVNYGSGLQGQAGYYGQGVFGYGYNGSEGVYGLADDSGWGVSGQSVNNAGVSGYGTIGILGQTNGSGAALAGEFYGNVTITGNLQVNGAINKSAVGFKIDHPLDPSHKYLMHSCVESNEMMNIYRGNVVLDSDGNADVVLPAWFEAENRDFCYQLTAIGAPAPGLYVGKKVDRGSFRISGGDPGMEVSWQITAARNDKYAQAHPVQVEMEKPAAEQGRYIQPEEFGKPKSKMIGYLPPVEHEHVKLAAPPVQRNPATADNASPSAQVAR